MNVLRKSTKTIFDVAQFKCKDQKVNTIKYQKDCLSCYDDKQWMCDDGISSYAHRHYHAKYTDEFQIDQQCQSNDNSCK